MSKFVVGLDLGQSMDHSAVAILERVEQAAMETVTRTVGNLTSTSTERIAKPPQLQCRHLARYELGTLYPTIVEQVAAMLDTERLRGARLVVDGTGVGRGVVDFMRKRVPSLIAITITSGSNAHFEGGYWRVPKRDLVAAAQVPLQDGRLKFAEGMHLAPTLIQELLNFKVKITESANDTYASWREGVHDDLALALMLACWWAQRPKPAPMPRSRTVSPFEW